MNKKTSIIGATIEAIVSDGSDNPFKVRGTVKGLVSFSMEDWWISIKTTNGTTMLVNPNFLILVKIIKLKESKESNDIPEDTAFN